mmetsp:Transcript_17645/g.46891  ORF Transcript_17645/g.46891 Transcript_17645/m.46891 type:complete len:383 (+) Transcript_17645:332-1480(+)
MRVAARVRWLGRRGHGSARTLPRRVAAVDARRRAACAQARPRRPAAGSDAAARHRARAAARLRLGGRRRRGLAEAVPRAGRRRRRERDLFARRPRQAQGAAVGAGRAGGALRVASGMVAARTVADAPARRRRPLDRERGRPRLRDVGSRAAPRRRRRVRTRRGRRPGPEARRGPRLGGRRGRAGRPLRRRLRQVVARRDAGRGRRRRIAYMRLPEPRGGRPVRGLLAVSAGLRGGPRGAAVRAGRSGERRAGRRAARRRPVSSEETGVSRRGRRRDGGALPRRPGRLLRRGAAAFGRGASGGPADFVLRGAPARIRLRGPLHGRGTARLRARRFSRRRGRVPRARRRRRYGWRGGAGFFGVRSVVCLLSRFWRSLSSLFVVI